MLHRIRCAAPLALAIALAAAGTAHADRGTTRFFSSFEPGDPQPRWTSTAERTRNVTGSVSSRIPGSVMEDVTEVQASGDNPPSETKERGVDGSASSKWLTFSPTGWLQVRLAHPAVVVRYALTAANDAPGRDPREWRLLGSDDGGTWTTLDTRKNQDLGDRFNTTEYSLANTTAYSYYRLDVTANHGDGILQLADLDLSDGDTTPPPPTDMRAEVGAGPVSGPNIKPAAGWTGLHALQYAGGHVADGRAFAYDKVFDVDVPVHGQTELSYMLFPELTGGDLTYPSTYAAVDLAFTDGTYLSDIARLSPRGAGRSKMLYADQWNEKVVRLGRVARGKTIDRILVGYDNPDGSAATRFGGWVDDIRLANRRPARHRHPSGWVLTTRGTNSSGGFSRGNNIPATAMPHGFNFYTPVTDADSLDWLYRYQADNNDDNLPELQALSISHEPSPWMGDRQTFQVMPSAAAGTPPTGRSERALAFRHENEVAKPYRYAVTFENGLKAQIAPADHAAMLRFRFPGADRSLVFDNVDEDHASLTIDGQTISGWSETRSGLSQGAARMYVYATLDQPVAASATTRDRTGWVRFAPDGDRTVTLRIATSFISLDQAKQNLALEIAPDDTFGDLVERARSAWDDKLSVVRVDGASEDQLATLYSNLYRLNLYPNSAFENTGTRGQPRYEHALQSTASSAPMVPAPVRPGKLYVNNGFWDTYRTVWPGYAFFEPQDAGELVDGFVQQYRDGGWVARWSSPGYANLMTGTSSDVSFADVYVKGVKGFDGRDAYDAALKNATVAPPGDPWNPSVGRKGLIESLFLGYTPDRVSEGVSWALEGDINDYGISNMADALARGAQGADRRRYREEAEYFRSRATDYVHTFDPRIGFFQGRDESGAFKSDPADYDPRVWGHDHDYTETDGWNFAFHAPQDGQGLANLYGGRQGLADKLDAFFATPETAKFPGSYGGTIHEMIEARDVRMGQWGFSNQVSHHIPWMYDYAGQPYKTQEKVREALRRLYQGSRIGAGYAGDEDNGETSAWYLFAALGFYPLQVGSPHYAIGSPLFERATVRLPGGRRLVVSAPGNSARNVYVQGVRLNGRPYDKAYIDHDDLVRGGTLEFRMGRHPSRWGTDRAAAPPSITHGDEPPTPLHDATDPHSGTVSADELFDDSSATEATAQEVRYGFASPRRVTFYTLTNGAAGPDPQTWTLAGSNDGAHWTPLDSRRGEPFEWRTQTRPFAISRPGSYRQYRIVVDSAARVAEVELLTRDANPPAGLAATVEAGAARAGSTAPVRVTVTNTSTRAASGMVAVTGPAGWTVAPAQAAFGPLAPGASATATLTATVPAGTAPGSYPVRATATAGNEVARAAGTVRVVGDTIAFTPGTDAEAAWLADPGGSQLTQVNGRTGRFADGTGTFTYRFDLPADVTGGTVTLDIGNQFLVETSTDGATFHEVLRETGDVRDLSNLRERSFDLGGAHTLYVRIGDARPENGWGGWLASVKVQLSG
jgi:predicted alpha-1,2-mannosidase